LKEKVAAPVQKAENTAVGIRRADHMTPSIRQMLALTSPTSGGLSVGIARSRTQATEFVSSSFTGLCLNMYSLVRLALLLNISFVYSSLKMEAFHYSETLVISHRMHCIISLTDRAVRPYELSFNVYCDFYQGCVHMIRV
jgi:hypothetical protein